MTACRRITATLATAAHRRRGLLPCAVLGILGAALLTSSCGGAGPQLAKGEGSALWLAGDDFAQLDAATRELLRVGGVRELFVEAGTLAGSELEPALGAATDVRMPVTLVVRGEWPGGDPGELAAALAPALRTLRRRAEERGLTPVGYHLDVVPPRGEEALESFAAALGPLRRAVDEELFLSVSLDAEALRSASAAEVAEAVDFVVPFLFGPRPGGGPAPDGDDAWSLAAMEPALARLADIGRPYLLGIGTAGSMRHLDAGGSPLEETTEGRLGELVRLPGLAAGRAGLFDALDRQSYGFEAERAVQVGPWRLARGEQVEVRRLAAHHLRRAARRAEEVSPELHLGQLYVRLPRPGEDLSVAPAELAVVAGEGPVLPRLELSLQPAGSGGRFRVRIANHGPVATDVAFYDNNYVELRALGGGFVAAVEPGGFQRYQLEHQGRRVTDMRALRAADRVKLFVALLEPGEAVESGPVELRGAPRGTPAVEATARFAVPGGEQVEVPAQAWPGEDGDR